LAGDGAASLPNHLGTEEQENNGQGDSGAEDKENFLPPRRDPRPPAPESKTEEGDEAGRNQGAPEERQDGTDGKMDGQRRQDTESPLPGGSGALFLKSPLGQAALEEKRAGAYTRRVAGERGTANGKKQTTMTKGHEVV